MTKYREILRLSSLNLSQQNIADSCNVSKKTVNRVLKRAKELGVSWPLDANETDAVLAEKFFPSAKQVKTKECLTTITSAKSCSEMALARNSYGQNTWKNAAQTAMSHSCILNSAIISNRMSRNIVQQCISTANPANRSKLTGQEILP